MLLLENQNGELEMILLQKFRDCIKTELVIFLCFACSRKGYQYDYYQGKRRIRESAVPVCCGLLFG